MKLKDYFLIALVAWGLISLYWNVDSREEIQSLRVEKERDKKTLERNDAQIRQLIDSVHKMDLAALKYIQAEKIRADRLEGELTIANEKLKSVRFVRFSSDSARTRAIKELYPTSGNR